MCCQKKWEMFTQHPPGPTRSHRMSSVWPPWCDVGILSVRKNYFQLPAWFACVTALWQQFFSHFNKWLLLLFSCFLKLSGRLHPRKDRNKFKDTRRRSFTFTIQGSRCSFLPVVASSSFNLFVSKWGLYKLNQQLCGEVTSWELQSCSSSQERMWQVRSWCICDWRRLLGDEHRFKCEN